VVGPTVCDEEGGEREGGTGGGGWRKGIWGGEKLTSFRELCPERRLPSGRFIR
jgi:hypothetical protein